MRLPPPSSSPSKNLLPRFCPWEPRHSQYLLSLRMHGKSRALYAKLGNGHYVCVLPIQFSPSSLPLSFPIPIHCQPLAFLPGLPTDKRSKQTNKRTSNCMNKLSLHSHLRPHISLLSLYFPIFLSLCSPYCYDPLIPERAREREPKKIIGVELCCYCDMRERRSVALSAESSFIMDTVVISAVCSSARAGDG